MRYWWAENLIIMKRNLFLLLAIISVVGMMVISGCKKAETYTITFDSNGGSGTMQQQIFTEGEAQKLAKNTFTRDGYIFSGWNGNGAVYIDEQMITINSDMILYAQWTEDNSSQGGHSQGGQGGENITPNPLNGHTWIDLGLPSRTKWATCNVGANTPEALGDYFAWGETTPKSPFTINWDVYNWCNGSGNTLTKYCDNPDYGDNGFTDNLKLLQPSDDAATANWGSGWRMPTRYELEELVDICTHETTSQNGVNGVLFTGPNGNKIFFPATFDSEFTGTIEIGLYWSNTLPTNDPKYAFEFEFYLDPDDFNIYVSEDYERYYRLSIRPVCAQ